MAPKPKPLMTVAEPLDKLRPKTKAELRRRLGRLERAFAELRAIEGPAPSAPPAPKQ